jgi:hypothetical protein
MLVGATAYRMLMGWAPNTVQAGEVVLVWGGAGGLGSQAIQIARERGGIPVAVISSDDKREFCERLGAKGCINRKDFSHWGMMPHWEDDAAYAEWSKGCRACGKASWEVVGERKSPRLVFEHPGESSRTGRLGPTLVGQDPRRIHQRFTGQHRLPPKSCLLGVNPTGLFGVRSVRPNQRKQIAASAAGRRL